MSEELVSEIFNQSERVADINFNYENIYSKETIVHYPNTHITNNKKDTIIVCNICECTFVFNKQLKNFNCKICKLLTNTNSMSVECGFPVEKKYHFRCARNHIFAVKLTDDILECGLCKIEDTFKKFTIASDSVLFNPYSHFRFHCNDCNCEFITNELMLRNHKGKFHECVDNHFITLDNREDIHAHGAILHTKRIFENIFGVPSDIGKLYLGLGTNVPTAYNDNVKFAFFHEREFDLRIYEKNQKEYLRRAAEYLNFYNKILIIIPKKTITLVDVSNFIIDSVYATTNMSVRINTPSISPRNSTKCEIDTYSLASSFDKQYNDFTSAQISPIKHFKELSVRKIADLKLKKIRFVPFKDIANGFVFEEICKEPPN